VKLWLLERADTEIVGWDETRGVVVAADTESDARELASTQRGDEGSATWLDPLRTTCGELVPGSAARVVLVDFKAG
jgi:hypothetical protein